MLRRECERRGWPLTQWVACVTCRVAAAESAPGHGSLPPAVAAAAAAAAASVCDAPRAGAASIPLPAVPPLAVAGDDAAAVCCSSQSPGVTRLPTNATLASVTYSREFFQPTFAVIQQTLRGLWSTALQTPYNGAAVNQASCQLDCQSESCSMYHNPGSVTPGWLWTMGGSPITWTQTQLSIGEPVTSLTPEGYLQFKFEAYTYITGSIPMQCDLKTSKTGQQCVSDGMPPIPVCWNCDYCGSDEPDTQCTSASFSIAGHWEVTLTLSNPDLRASVTYLQVFPQPATPADISGCDKFGLKGNQPGGCDPASETAAAFQAGVAAITGDSGVFASSLQGALQDVLIPKNSLTSDPGTCSLVSQFTELTYSAAVVPVPTALLPMLAVTISALIWMQPPNSDQPCVGFQPPAPLSPPFTLVPMDDGQLVSVRLNELLFEQLVLAEAIDLGYVDQSYQMQFLGANFTVALKLVRVGSEPFVTTLELASASVVPLPPAGPLEPTPAALAVFVPLAFMDLTCLAHHNEETGTCGAGSDEAQSTQQVAPSTSAFMASSNSRSDPDPRDYGIPVNNTFLLSMRASNLSATLLMYPRCATAGFGVQLHLQNVATNTSGLDLLFPPVPVPIDQLHDGLQAAAAHLVSPINDNLLDPEQGWLLLPHAMWLPSGSTWSSYALNDSTAGPNSLVLHSRIVTAGDPSEAGAPQPAFVEFIFSKPGSNVNRQRQADKRDLWSRMSMMTDEFAPLSLGFDPAVPSNRSCYADLMGSPNTPVSSLDGVSLLLYVYASTISDSNLDCSLDSPGDQVSVYRLRDTQGACVGVPVSSSNYLQASAADASAQTKYFAVNFTRGINDTLSTPQFVSLNWGCSASCTTCSINVGASVGGGSAVALADAVDQCSVPNNSGQSIWLRAIDGKLKSRDCSVPTGAGDSTAQSDHLFIGNSIMLAEHVWPNVTISEIGVAPPPASHTCTGMVQPQIRSQFNALADAESTNGCVFSSFPLMQLWNVGPLTASTPTAWSSTPSTGCELIRSGSSVNGSESSDLWSGIVYEVPMRWFQVAASCSNYTCAAPMGIPQGQTSCVMRLNNATLAGSGGVACQAVPFVNGSGALNAYLPADYFLVRASDVKAGCPGPLSSSSDSALIVAITLVGLGVLLFCLVLWWIFHAESLKSAISGIADCCGAIYSGLASVCVFIYRHVGTFLSASWDWCKWRLAPFCRCRIWPVLAASSAWLKDALVSRRQRAWRRSLEVESEFFVILHKHRAAIFSPMLVLVMLLSLVAVVSWCFFAWLNAFPLAHIGADPQDAFYQSFGVSSRYFSLDGIHTLLTTWQKSGYILFGTAAILLMGQLIGVTLPEMCRMNMKDRPDSSSRLRRRRSAVEATPHRDAGSGGAHIRMQSFFTSQWLILLLLFILVYILLLGPPFFLRLGELVSVVQDSAYFVTRNEEMRQILNWALSAATGTLLLNFLCSLCMLISLAAPVAFLSVATFTMLTCPWLQRTYLESLELAYKLQDEETTNMRDEAEPEPEAEEHPLADAAVPLLDAEPEALPLEPLPSAVEGVYERDDFGELGSNEQSMCVFLFGGLYRYLLSHLVGFAIFFGLAQLPFAVQLYVSVHRHQLWMKAWLGALLLPFAFIVAWMLIATYCTYQYPPVLQRWLYSLFRIWEFPSLRARVDAPRVLLLLLFGACVGLSLSYVHQILELQSDVIYLQTPFMFSIYVLLLVMITAAFMYFGSLRRLVPLIANTSKLLEPTPGLATRAGASTSKQTAQVLPASPLAHAHFSPSASSAASPLSMHSYQPPSERCISSVPSFDLSSGQAPAMPAAPAPVSDEWARRCPGPDRVTKGVGKAPCLSTAATPMPTVAMIRCTFVPSAAVRNSSSTGINDRMSTIFMAFVLLSWLQLRGFWTILANSSGPTSYQAQFNNEVQKQLHMNPSTWGTPIFDDVFNLYTLANQWAFSLRLCGLILLAASIYLHASHRPRMATCATFLSSLLTFFGLIAIFFPAYLSAVHLDHLCTHCGQRFDDFIVNSLSALVGLGMALFLQMQLAPAIAFLSPIFIRVQHLLCEAEVDRYLARVGLKEIRRSTFAHWQLSDSIKGTVAALLLSVLFAFSVSQASSFLVVFCLVCSLFVMLLVCTLLFFGWSELLRAYHSVRWSLALMVKREEDLRSMEPAAASEEKDSAAPLGPQIPLHPAERRRIELQQIASYVSHLLDEESNPDVPPLYSNCAPHSSLSNLSYAQLTFRFSYPLSATLRLMWSLSALESLARCCAILSPFLNVMLLVVVYQLEQAVTPNDLSLPLLVCFWLLPILVALLPFAGQCKCKRIRKPMAFYQHALTVSSYAYFAGVYYSLLMVYLLSVILRTTQFREQLWSLFTTDPYTTMTDAATLLCAEFATTSVLLGDLFAMLVVAEDTSRPDEPTQGEAEQARADAKAADEEHVFQFVHIPLASASTAPPENQELARLPGSVSAQLSNGGPFVCLGLDHYASTDALNQLADAIIAAGHAADAARAAQAAAEATGPIVSPFPPVPVDPETDLTEAAAIALCDHWLATSLDAVSDSAVYRFQLFVLAQLHGVDLTLWAWAPDKPRSDPDRATVRFAGARLQRLTHPAHRGATMQGERALTPGAAWQRILPFLLARSPPMTPATASASLHQCGSGVRCACYVPCPVASTVRSRFLSHFRRWRPIPSVVRAPLHLLSYARSSTRSDMNPILCHDLLRPQRATEEDEARTRAMDAVDIID